MLMRIAVLMYPGNLAGVNLLDILLELLLDQRPSQLIGGREQPIFLGERLQGQDDLRYVLKVQRLSRSQASPYLVLDPDPFEVGHDLVLDLLAVDESANVPLNALLPRQPHEGVGPRDHHSRDVVADVAAVHAHLCHILARRIHGLHVFQRHEFRLTRDESNDITQVSLIM